MKTVDSHQSGEKKQAYLGVRKPSVQTDYLCAPSSGAPRGQACSPGRHWAGWPPRPGRTNTAGALHDGTAAQKPLCCCLDPWALSGGEERKRFIYDMPVR